MTNTNEHIKSSVRHLFPVYYSTVENNNMTCERGKLFMFTTFMCSLFLMVCAILFFGSCCSVYMELFYVQYCMHNKHNNRQHKMTKLQIFIVDYEPQCWIYAWLLFFFCIWTCIVFKVLKFKRYSSPIYPELCLWLRVWLCNRTYTLKRRYSITIF
jgi:hypothetical protein